MGLIYAVDQYKYLPLAFELRHGHDRPEVLAYLRRLWAQFRDEIVSATPPGATPWIQRAIEAPESLDEDATDETDEGGE